MLSHSRPPAIQLYSPPAFALFLCTPSCNAKLFSLLPLLSSESPPPPPHQFHHSSSWCGFVCFAGANSFPCTCLVVDVSERKDTRAHTLTHTQSALIQPTEKFKEFDLVNEFLASRFHLWRARVPLLCFCKKTEREDRDPSLCHREERHFWLVSTFSAIFSDRPRHLQSMQFHSLSVGC